MLALIGRQDMTRAITEAWWFTWAIGLGVSIVIGRFVTWGFLETLRWHMHIPETNLDPSTRGVPAWFTGAAERLFFTVLVAFHMSGVTVAMIAWIAAKLDANWNRSSLDEPKYDRDTIRRARGSFSILLAGLVSMLFALLGGLICSGDIPISWVTFR
jgi:hypothetical protein